MVLPAMMLRNITSCALRPAVYSTLYTAPRISSHTIGYAVRTQRLAMSTLALRMATPISIATTLSSLLVTNTVCAALPGGQRRTRAGRASAKINRGGERRLLKRMAGRRDGDRRVDYIAPRRLARRTDPAWPAAAQASAAYWTARIGRKAVPSPVPCSVPAGPARRAARRVERAARAAELLEWQRDIAKYDRARERNTPSKLTPHKKQHRFITMFRKRSYLRRKRHHGFLRRLKSHNGRRTLLRRMLKGRRRLSA